MHHLVLAGLFFAFAIFQWNDPDFYLWMPVYGAVGVIAVLGFKKKFYRYPTLIFAGGLILWMATYIPHIIDWLKDGMPNIASSMKAESPYIELTREFFGIFICFAAIWYYYLLSKKQQNA